MNAAGERPRHRQCRGRFTGFQDLVPSLVQESACKGADVSIRPLRGSLKHWGGGTDSPMNAAFESC